MYKIPLGNMLDKKKASSWSYSNLSVNELNVFPNNVYCPNCSLSEHKFCIDLYGKYINSFFKVNYNKKHKVVEFICVLIWGQALTE